MAASSTAPVARQSKTTIRPIGNPSPAFWLLDGGYSAWFSGVSAKVMVAPSTRRTRRFCQCHPAGAPSVTSPPVWRVRVVIIGNGSRARAWQYALVLVL